MSKYVPEKTPYLGTFHAVPLLVNHSFPIYLPENRIILDTGKWRFYLKCVLLIVSYHLNFLCVSNVSSMLHHVPVGRVHSKECYFIFTYNFFTYFVDFHQKIVVFIIFISFLMKYQISTAEY